MYLYLFFVDLLTRENNRDIFMEKIEIKSVYFPIYRQYIIF